MTIEEKKKYYWNTYGISIGYSNSDIWSRDRRVTRYDIDMPYIEDDQINFMKNYDAFTNVRGCDIDSCIKSVFKRDPLYKADLRRLMEELHEKNKLQALC